MKKVIKILLILFLILIIASGIFAGYFHIKLKKFSIENSQQQPIDLPKISIEKDAFKTKRRSVEEFMDGLKKGKCENQYEIVGEEINALIKDNYNLLWTKWVYATVEDSKINIDFSIPLKSIYSDIKDEKFLNGTIKSGFEYSDEKINIDVDTYKLGERDVMEGESNRHFSYPLYGMYKTLLKSVDNINVNGDKIIIKCKE